MPTTSDIKAYMQHALWVSEWVTDWGVVEEDGVVEDQRDSLWGSSLVRSSPGHSGGETNQREQRRRKENVPKAPGCCGSIQGAIAANKSSKDGIEKQVY